jgi:hypothetical protein
MSPSLNETRFTPGAPSPGKLREDKPVRIGNVHSALCHPARTADDATLLAEAHAITDAARDRGLRLRLLGAVAVHLHSPGREALESRLNRLGDANRRFTDLDFAAYGAERAAVRTLLEDRFGLLADPQSMLFHGKERIIYAQPAKGYQVDVFFDRLRFSHTIELGGPGTGRLDRDFPTLTPADLLLSKVQIHRATDKDLKDAILLLLAHRLSDGDDTDAIEIARVVAPLADDWGFWKDATANLEEIRTMAGRLADTGLLDRADAEAVREKVGALLRVTEQTPKSRSWRRGERRLATHQWWNDVESVVR